jgi:RsiW-degrading membrane proteinase PrsW (M82 family)
MVIVAVLLATAIPLLFLYAVHTLDLYGSGSARAILLSFFWGLPAVAVAAFLSTRLSPGRAVLAVPLLEELLKALVLLYLVRRPSFTYFVDGAVYGFAVGIGFAIFENLLYLYQHPATGLSTAAGRVLSTNLMHAGTSAVVGVALGLARFQRFSRRALFLGAGLTLAVLFHAGFNRLVTAGGGPLLPLYAVLAGLGALAFVALTIRRGLEVQRRWIVEKLGDADRVTAAESDAVT